MCVRVYSATGGVWTDPASAPAQTRQTLTSWYSNSLLFITDNTAFQTFSPQSNTNGISSGLYYNRRVSVKHLYCIFGKYSYLIYFFFTLLTLYLLKCFSPSSFQWLLRVCFLLFMVVSCNAECYIYKPRVDLLSVESILDNMKGNQNGWCIFCWGFILRCLMC